jgi:hypothetical protein
VKNSLECSHHEDNHHTPLVPKGSRSAAKANPEDAFSRADMDCHRSGYGDHTATGAADRSEEMTDKELLELAAKAICFQYDDVAYDGTLCFGKGRWNPLTDDGDALRLAVKLGLSLKHYYYEGDYFIKVPVNDVAMTEPLATDPYAATRRAIVRAAAEIGKAL